ncbi:exo-arabinanase [Haloferax gibbonsii ATCC 33959]|uniref:Exo-arabinanase n=1 Tax=Haloferax gibbonsii (strain ATCC 33959 / DSM 4427 / JCM 8863 / NBRC 102184 / NCIMB 2188 / Ma 2.38) TaxID=1227459 RepID=M0HQY1_HALGM|nr:sialidase family protein [Haloferax gibbonsii]ELZ85494.1 exo-arabinanase [Haloferax gibbonsii ATCC 33959]
MSERDSIRQHSRRKYLAAVGAVGAAAVGSTGVIAGSGRDDEQTDVEGTLYSPPSDAPVPGSLYPRVTRLKHGSGKGGEKQLLATFEFYPSMSGGSEPYFPVYRSTDGGRTWSKFSEIHDTSGKDWGLRYQPTLFELPHAVGPWPAGTVLAAGNSIPILDDPEDVPEGEVGELGETSIDLYASTDRGASWEFVSTVVTGGKAVPYDGNSPVWEPELGLDDDGNLVCYFADERMGSDDDYNQLVAYKASEDGGRSWGDEQFVAAIPDETTRPGMPTVTPLPNGTYMMSYEVIGPDYLYGEVHVKTSPDGRDWGDPTDAGTLVSTADGRRFINGPYVTWTRAGGKDGTILVSGKQLVDGNRELAEGNGEVVLANSNLDGSGDWEAVDAPLSFETEGDLGGRAFVGWTTPLLPSRHGDELLQLTSVADGPNLCEISYGVQSLKLDDGT